MTANDFRRLAGNTNVRLRGAKRAAGGFPANSVARVTTIIDPTTAE